MRIAFALVLTACSSSSSRPMQTVQRTTAEHTCEDVAWSCVSLKPGTDVAWGCIEGNATQTAQYQASCTTDKDGRFALNPCLRDTVVGGCTLARGSQCTTTWYFEPASRPAIEADCAKQAALFVAP